MIDLEHARERFKNHVAILNTYGPISVLDFQKPFSVEYRIRFVFENDHYYLHISGDLGCMSACNFKNMNIDDFYDDFASNPGYFEEKIDSHERPLYEWDEDDAREELRRKLVEDYGMDEEEEGDTINDILDDVLDGYDDGVGPNLNNYSATSRLESLDPDWWIWAPDLGKHRTGIVELYMLAFRLAWEQLHGGENGNPG